MWGKKNIFIAMIHNRQVRVLWKNPPKLCSMQHDREVLLKEMQGSNFLNDFFFSNLCSLTCHLMKSVLLVFKVNWMLAEIKSLFHLSNDLECDER